MVMLINFICIFITAAIAAAVFIFARQIGYTQRNAELVEQKLKEMQAQLEQLDLEYRTLEMQYEQEKHDRMRQAYQPRGGWDPGQLTDRQ